MFSFYECIFLIMYQLRFSVNGIVAIYTVRIDIL